MSQKAAKARKNRTKQKQKQEQRQRLRLLQEWTQTVSDKLPHLSKPHVTILAFWSFGMVIANSCGLTTVAVYLATL